MANAKTTAEKNYRNEETAAYLESVTEWAEIDAYYRQFEANSFASAVLTAAQADSSPWIEYDAAKYAARADRVTAESNAAQTKAITQATAQHDAEIANTNAEAFWKTVQVSASGTFRQAAAWFDRTLAGVQATAIAALGATGVYRTDLPSLGDPPNLTGVYTVSGASTYDYSIYLPEAHSTNSWYGYGSYYGWNWGSWGYYGHNHWWYGNPWYGGYWDYWYAIAGSVYLSQPSEQFAKSFWDVIAESVSHESVHQESRLSPRSLVPEKASWSIDLPTPSFDRLEPVLVVPTQTDVLRALERLDDTVADFWGFLGRTTRSLLAERPSLERDPNSTYSSEEIARSASDDSAGTSSQPMAELAFSVIADKGTSPVAVANQFQEKTQEQADEKFSKFVPNNSPIRPGNGQRGANGEQTVAEARATLKS